MTVEKRGFFVAQDMTEGPVLRSLIYFSIPLLIGNIFQQLYNTVDAFVIGRFAGSTPFAAVGASGNIIFFFISLFIGIATGAGVLISQAFGAKDRQWLEKTISTMYMLTLFVSGVLTIAGFLFSRPILLLLKTPKEILDDAVAYLQIIFIGMIASAAYNTIGGVMRAVGDSVTPLIFLIVATLLNIALDVLFVAVFGWGVRGVAWATIIAQGVSAALSIFRLNRMDKELHLTFRHLKLYWEIIPEILRIGLPSGVQQISISLGSMVIQGLINSLGVVVLAGYTSFIRIDTFTSMPMMTISMAVTTYVGQNMGARRIDRVDRGIRVSTLLVVLVAVVMSALSLVFAGPLLGLFTPGESDVIDAGRNVLFRVAPFYFLLGIMFCMGGVMRGAGEARVPMISSIMSVCLIRVPLAYILYGIFKMPDSIWWAIPIGWGLGCIFQLLYYRFSGWKSRAVRRMEVMGSRGVSEIVEP